MSFLKFDLHSSLFAYIVMYLDLFSGEIRFILMAIIDDHLFHHQVGQQNS